MSPSSKLCKFNLKCTPHPPYERHIWHFGRAEKDKLLRASRMYDWTGQLTQMNNIENQIGHIEDVISNISKNFIPNESKIFNPRDPSWLTINCKDFYKKYRCKYKRFARRGFIPAERGDIDKMRLEYTNLVQTEKDEYLRQLGSEVSNPQTTQKRYWTVLKKILNKT